MNSAGKAITYALKLVERGFFAWGRIQTSAEAGLSNLHWPGGKDCGRTEVGNT
jgi:hypothetical protein